MMETPTLTRKTEAKRSLTAELREYFTAYFTRKYPATKKITIKRYYSRYTARVHYRGENPHRTFFVRASTYEELVSRVQEAYTFRNVAAFA